MAIRDYFALKRQVSTEPSQLQFGHLRVLSRGGGGLATDAGQTAKNLRRAVVAGGCQRQAQRLVRKAESGQFSARNLWPETFETPKYT